MKHNHLNIGLIEQQLQYENSTAGLVSARQIIGAKIRNQGMFLTNYARTRTMIRPAQTQIVRAGDDLRFATSKQDIFQIEARASRSYWEAVRVLCKQNPDWCRVYPHARDPLNQLLNIGYTALSGEIWKVVAESALVPEVGMLHGRNSHDPLVYDLMEPWRVPVVDACVVPFFSRKKCGYQRLTPRNIALVQSRIFAKFDSLHMYKKVHQKLRRSLSMEVWSLKRAVEEQKSWSPDTYKWGHRRPTAVSTPKEKDQL